MADILTLPQAIPAATPAAKFATGLGETGQARRAASTRAAPDAAISFADLLISCNDKLPTHCGKRVPPAADALSLAADAAVTPSAAQTIDPSALPARPEPDSAAAPNVDSAAILGAISPPSLNMSADAPIPTGQTASPSLPSIGPVSMAQFLPPAPTANALGVAGAVSPAPTIVKGDAREQRDNLDHQKSVLLPDTAIDRKATPDKLAVETAIPADSGKTSPLTSAAGEPAPDFRAAMERLTNHPATAGMQAIGTTRATLQPNMHVETPLGQPGWGQEVSDKLTWMVGNNRQQADLVLNPPQLGRIEVSMIIEGDKVSATFTSANIAVREALENSMVRLRDVLADAGVTLGDTHVGAESRQDARSSDTRNDKHPSGNAGRDSAVTPTDAIARGSTWINASGRGMVDIFA